MIRSTDKSDKLSFKYNFNFRIVLNTLNGFLYLKPGYNSRESIYRKIICGNLNYILPFKNRGIDKDARGAVSSSSVICFAKCQKWVLILFADSGRFFFWLFCDIYYIFEVIGEWLFLLFSAPFVHNLPRVANTFL
jgi:hypothetical protein